MCDLKPPYLFDLPLILLIVSLASEPKSNLSKFVPIQPVVNPLSLSRLPVMGYHLYSWSAIFRYN